MKKNLISVIILALVFANLVLTGLLMFTVLPETKKANELIEKVCAAIDLDLNSGSATGMANVPIENTESYPLNGGETLTLNLKADGSGKSHFAVVAVTLTLNTKSDNYEKYSPTALAGYEDVMLNNITAIISQYTKEEFDADTQKVQQEILENMQGMFGADYIVAVNFPKRQTD